MKKHQSDEDLTGIDTGDVEIVIGNPNDVDGAHVTEQ